MTTGSGSSHLNGIQPYLSTDLRQPTGRAVRWCASLLLVVALIVTLAGTATASSSVASPSDGDEFTNGLASWWALYDSVGNGGNGVRDPHQIAVAQGIMTMSGTAGGRSAGMLGNGHGHRYGMWTTRMRVDKQGPGAPYHPVIALVPEGVPYNGGAGDVDFAETDAGSGEVFVFVHHGAGVQDYYSIKLDLTQWHTYDIEITPDHLTWFVDGTAAWTDTNRSAVPTTTLAMNVQLDANQPDGLAPSNMQVDYFRYYAPV